MKHSPEHVKKGWGYELIIDNTDRYCGKILHFDKRGSKGSMHFHAAKDETWYVLSGSFTIIIVNKDASRETIKLSKGDCMRVPKLTVHQIYAAEDNSSIIEVSSTDFLDDSHRVIGGDSQS